MSSFTVIGSNSSASAASIVITTTVAANVGDLVLVGGGAAKNSPTWSLSDNHTNSWTKDEQQNHSFSAISGVVYRTTVTTLMPIGSTITIGHASTAGLIGACAIVAPNPTATPLDVTPSKTAQSASPGSAASTGTTASPLTTNWVGITVAASDTGSLTFTPQAGWTEAFDAQGVEVQAIAGSTTTAMQGAATVSSALSDWVALVAVYKITPASASASSLALLGVG